MKREIKFKAKRVDNGEWAYGLFIELICETQGGDYPVDELLSFIVPIGQNEVDDYVEVDPETVSQFTGLKDKNGTDIYEGDICYNSNRTPLTSKNDTREYLVEFKEGEFSIGGSGNSWLSQKPSFVFTKINEGKENYMSLIFSQSQIEVTGNIHN